MPPETGTHYIMTPSLFHQLSQISNFNAVNGNTYQEHILLIAGDRILEDLHPQIKATISEEQALAVLTSHGVPFTHTYDA